MLNLILNGLSISALKGFFLILLSVVMPSGNSEFAYANRFENYEIRVVRPKYFAKRMRLEVGSQATVVMNQSFIYTYMVSGLLTFHINEALAVEGSFTYGDSVDKDDTVILDNEFGISTKIIRTQSMADGSILWTPIYGKYQLSSGSLIYFDTFLLGGVNQSSVEYSFGFCDPPGDDQELRADYVQAYTGYTYGIGQRYFLSKNSSVRWDVRNRVFEHSNLDGECYPEGLEEVLETQQNVTFQLGMSYFI